MAEIKIKAKYQKQVKDAINEEDEEYFSEEDSESEVDESHQEVEISVNLDQPQIELIVTTTEQ